MARPILAEEPSGALRDRVLAELEALRSSEEAAVWARDGLIAKNTLSKADADAIEALFRAKLASLGERQDAEDISRVPANASLSPSGSEGDQPAEHNLSSGESNRRRPVAKTIRLRDKGHLKFVSRQPCLICGRKPTDPHHLRFAQPRALARKVSDEFTVPLCRLHHRELHRTGDEAAWWTGLNIDPIPTALSLWRRRLSDETHDGSAIASDRAQ
jgi:hypothetical protein